MNRKHYLKLLRHVGVTVGQVDHLDELSDHGGTLGGTRSGESGHALGDGAVGLFMRQSGALGVNGAGQHPEQVHVTQTRSVGGH